MIEDGASSLQTLTTKTNMETSLNYDSLAKIQVVLDSKAFALALLPRTI